MKICKKCDRNHNRLGNICSACSSRSYRKKITPEQREEILRKKRLYNEKHKEENRRKRKIYADLNQEKIKSQRKKWYKNSKDKILASAKERHAKNRKKISIKRKEERERNRGNQVWIKEKRERARRHYHKKKNDPIFKIKYSVRGMIRKILKKKIKKSFDYIGCSPEQLVSHLESTWQDGMSWDNYGLYGWHIDHIKPINTFDLSNPEDLQKCSHYTNLRALWAHENLSRPKDGSDIKLNTSTS